MAGKARRRTRVQQQPAARVARQPATPAHEPLQERAASAPAQILQLQRMVGNRATRRLLEQPAPAAPGVVQRLLYHANSQTVHVPQHHFTHPIPFEHPNQNILRGKLPANQPSTLQSFYNYGGTKNDLLSYMAAGLQVGGITTIHSHDNGSLNNMVTSLLADSTNGPVKNRLQSVFKTPREVLSYHAGDTFYDEDSINSATQKALLPNDYLPDQKDLPDPGVSVKKGTAYWNKTCALIAVVKADGNADKIKALTGYQGDDLEGTVQALHNYYMGQGVEYDEAGTHPRVFGDFGYSLIFTGPVTFANLHTKIPLVAGQTYIFDIKGHALKVRIRQALPAKNQAMAQFDQYYEPVSDIDNYTDNPFTKDVLYIYAK